MNKIEFKNLGDPIVIVSHPRSGTHLTIDLIRKQFASCASYKFPLEPQHYLYLSIEGFLDTRTGKGLSEEEGLKIIKRPKRPIIKFHTYSYQILQEKYPSWMNWIKERGKFIYVMRDVREVLCSHYIYAQSFREDAKVPLSEFIRQPYGGEVNRVAYWKSMVEFWLSQPNTLVVDYKEIIKNTRSVIGELGLFINEPPLYAEPFLPKKLNSLWEFRLERIFSIKPESTAILGERSGKKLDWKKEFDTEDIKFIDTYLGDFKKKTKRL